MNSFLLEHRCLTGCSLPDTPSGGRYLFCTLSVGPRCLVSLLLALCWLSFSGRYGSVAGVLFQTFHGLQDDIHCFALSSICILDCLR